MDSNRVYIFDTTLRDEFQKGFDIMESGMCGKVILNWEE